MYRAKATVNWCPGCQTVLANEQVLADGTCERSGDIVEKRDLEQWFFKITEYAQQLLDDLDQLDWPERVITMQRNWIGRSEGAEFEMQVSDDKGKPTGQRFRVYTTRPDTSFGMTFCVLAPEHELVEEITTPEHRDEVTAFVARVRKESEVERLSSEGGLDKRGVFTGAYAINPFNNEPVPIYLADYVLTTYGTGAIMAVPGQDQRDWDFAKAYGLPIVRTVQPPDDWEGEAYTSATGRPSTASGSTGCTRPTRSRRPSSGWKTRASASARSTSACATGCCRASGSGAARSRSSTAPTTAPCRCPTSSCRSSRPTTSSSGPRASRRCASTRAS